MRNFIYLIGSMDDFDSIEDLKTEYFKDPSGVEPDRRNMSVFPVVPGEACAVKG